MKELLDMFLTFARIGGFTFGPLAAAVISILVAFIEMITISTTGPIGFIGRRMKN